ncbi:MAG: glycosyltransferase family 4 protein [Verrucomicrobia bacterium]|nr:glycosyltransferase family 4 protein [Verrucomicrobiota bacterium]
MQVPEIRKIAFLGNYQPRRCGIATFTTDLCAAVAGQYPEVERLVVALNDQPAGYDYPPEVRFEIAAQDLCAYQRAADFLNHAQVDAVCVQHEFGIYGGPAGQHLLTLLRDLTVPIVTTLHTVLAEPNPEQRHVMAEIVRLSSRLVVMTERAAQLMQKVFQAPSEKIDLIPHGIPDVPFVDPNYYKDLFKVEGKQVLLTFGLLSPNKGIEYVLDALPAILKQFPDVVYIVLGATHPALIREQGEAYRKSLEERARKNGVAGSVHFHNQFVSLDELKEFIGAADIYITPYLVEAQVTSGTLAYTFGSGKAVVSTPYWHAAELLADDRGVLVPFRDSAAIVSAVTGLLGDDTRRHEMRKQAYKLGRKMIWSEVAHGYMHSFQHARRTRAALLRKFHPVSHFSLAEPLPTPQLEHLCAMTDSTGMFQHSRFTAPNFSHGYCTDDNARALIATVLLGELGEDPARLDALATRYASFLHHAFDPATGRFLNFMNFDRNWQESLGSEDSHGRALWALGVYTARGQQRGLQLLAQQLFERALPAVNGLGAIRATAFALIGLNEYLRRFAGDRQVAHLRDQLVARLMTAFEANADEQWLWPENILAYDNAKLPHALIVSGHRMQQPAIMETGLKVLRWLVEQQTAEAGYFRPIGSNGFYPRGGVRAEFDQQPVEAQSTVSACLAAYRCTSDRYWYEQARLAFDWFLGRNDLGLPVCDMLTGSCRDGLQVDRLNQNQGAESTLSYLLALAELQQLRHSLHDAVSLGRLIAQ